MASDSAPHGYEYAALIVRSSQDGTCIPPAKDWLHKMSRRNAIKLNDFVNGDVEQDGFTLNLTGGGAATKYVYKRTMNIDGKTIYEFTERCNGHGILVSAIRGAMILTVECTPQAQHAMLIIARSMSGSVMFAKTYKASDQVRCYDLREAIKVCLIAQSLLTCHSDVKLVKASDGLCGPYIMRGNYVIKDPIYIKKHRRRRTCKRQQLITKYFKVVKQ